MCPLCAPDDSDDEFRCIPCNAPDADGLQPAMQEEPSQREGQPATLAPILSQQSTRSARSGGRWPAAQRVTVVQRHRQARRRSCELTTRPTCAALAPASYRGSHLCPTFAPSHRSVRAASHGSGVSALRFGPARTPPASLLAGCFGRGGLRQYCAHGDRPSGALASSFYV